MRFHSNGRPGQTLGLVSCKLYAAFDFADSNLIANLIILNVKFYSCTNRLINDNDLRNRKMLLS